MTPFTKKRQKVIFLYLSNRVLQQEVVATYLQ
jgi:hypothetical protein